jgi:hypothetical protein
LPNTLAHIAVNSISTKILIRNSEILWIYIGCIIPDLPWILRKIISYILPQINGYDLQVYSIIQSSLIFSILLSISFSLLGQSRIRTFLILSIGSILHLLLDITQIKWANGVILFAPFSWELTSYGFFWPENIINYAITFSGFLYLVINWKKTINEKLPISIKYPFFILSFVLFLTYLLTPFLFIQDVYDEDNHFVTTLKNFEVRQDKYVELDRKSLIFNDSTNSYWIQSFDQDLIELSELHDVKSTRISVRGIFATNTRIKVIDYHENWDLFRDGASYLGLSLVLLIWVLAIKNQWA